MDSDNEMMVQLFTEEQNAAAVRRQQQQLIPTSFLCIRQPLFGVPRRGGSKPGKRRNVSRHRQAGAMLLDVDYFVDDVSHSPKEFRRRIRINKDMFMKIVFGVREYEDYFMIKQYCTRYYLVDGIYPTYATFVKTVTTPTSEMDAYFTICQEAACKDVERAFGVLQ
nr:uncharacterized protein LOC127304246 [Lolium perenne]